MSVLEKIEYRLAERTSRKSFIGRLMKGSVVAGAAVVGLAFPSTALAVCRYVACCALSYCSNCSNCSCTGSCWSSQAWSWTCVWTGGDGCQYQCVECPKCSCSCAVRLCSPGCPCFTDAGVITTKYVPATGPIARS